MLSLFTTADGLASNQIQALLEDDSGNLWVGTLGGLSRRAEERFVSYGQAQGLASATVLALHEDAGGTVWVGTQGGGLCRLRSGLFACFMQEDGLTDNSVLQIVEDRQNRLWLGSMKGISRVKKRQLDALIRGRIDRLTPVTYGSADGLRSREMNGGVQPAAWRAADGRLWFASVRGVAVVDPARLQVNTLPPDVELKSLHINGAPINLGEDARLSPGSRDFEFHYTGLSLAAPESVHFRYKLHGYDEDWVDAEERRGAFYTNLPPGSYEFEVKARNHDGVWSTQSASVSFYVAPFFYETPWFYGLCMVALGLVSAGGYRLYVRHLHERELEQLVQMRTQELHAREAELKTLNEDLEGEVQTQLNQRIEERQRYEEELIAAKEKAEASARFKAFILQNMSHEIRTPISGILGYAQVLADELTGTHREFASYIEKNGDRLMSTITSILDLSRLEAGGVELNCERFDLATLVQDAVDLLLPLAQEKALVLRAEVPERPLLVYQDPSAVSRILHNLVGNAIKFTDEGEVVARLEEEAASLRLTVGDTGIGISEDFLPELFSEFRQESAGLAWLHEGSGLGLSITKHLVEAMGGIIEVESTHGEGTAFTVTLPQSKEAVSGEAETRTGSSAAVGASA